MKPLPMRQGWDVNQPHQMLLTHSPQIPFHICGLPALHFTHTILSDPHHLSSTVLGATQEETEVQRGVSLAQEHKGSLVSVLGQDNPHEVSLMAHPLPGCWTPRPPAPSSTSRSCSPNYWPSPRAPGSLGTSAWSADLSEGPGPHGAGYVHSSSQKVGHAGGGGWQVWAENAPATLHTAWTAEPSMAGLLK